MLLQNIFQVSTHYCELLAASLVTKLLSAQSGIARHLPFNSLDNAEFLKWKWTLWDGCSDYFMSGKKTFFSTSGHEKNTHTLSMYRRVHWRFKLYVVHLKEQLVDLLCFHFTFKNKNWAGTKWGQFHNTIKGSTNLKNLLFSRLPWWFFKIYEKYQWLNFSLDTQPEIKICNGL